MFKVLVLGGGLVGGTIAREIARDNNYEVTLFDFSQATLDRITAMAPIKGVKFDLTDSEALKSAVKDFDVVVNALPISLGLHTLKAVIEAGKNVVDISAGPVDFITTTLDNLAKSKGVTVVFDIGVAPGMTNALVGYGTSLLDEPQEAIILVGGIPVKREWPYEYKATWSPIDVLWEYNQPAQQLINGEIVVKPALTEIELIDFPRIGTLEAFNTDGARSLIKTKLAPTIIEKTLRYPGHAEKIRMLRETGFLSSEEIDIKGTKIKPIDLSAKLLFSKWDLKDDEDELTILRVTVTGKKDNKKVRYTYDMLVYRDFEQNNNSMSRATGFPCAIMTKMVAEGEFKYDGVCLPEYIGQNHTIFKKLLQGLKERGVVYTEKVEYLD